MAAASRAVSTSGRVARALVEEPARSSGAVGEGSGWAWERSPGSGVGGHWCSWAGGAVAGRGRSAGPSAAVAAGVGPYLDPAPRCGVFSLVGGLIARLLASQAKGDRRGAARSQAPGLMRSSPLQPGSLLLIGDRSTTGSSGIPQRRQLHPREWRLSSRVMWAVAHPSL